MKDRIINKLKEIEEKEGVVIIGTVESGSRVWGFASEDSDYDVRFLYVRNEKDYLRLEKVRDVIEWQLDDVYDINGWDVRKALQLLYKSNPTLLEWCSSHIIYKDSEAFTLFKETVFHYFNEKSSFHHYLHMSDNKLKGDIVRLKNYFYVLRTLLAAKWVITKHTQPPIEFNTLKETFLPEELKPIVDELLDKKINSTGKIQIKRIKELDDYIAQERAYLNAQTPENTTQKDWEELNNCFLKLIEITR